MLKIVTIYSSFWVDHDFLRENFSEQHEAVKLQLCHHRVHADTLNYPEDVCSAIVCEKKVATY